ncbi:MAG: hypothetical protein WDW38_006783 [Sanguina aurantia]
MTSVTLFYAGPPVQRHVFKATAMMPLSQLLAEACSKMKPAMHPECCQMLLAKKRLDPTLSFRNANIPAGSKIEVARATPAPSPAIPSTAALATSTAASLAPDAAVQHSNPITDASGSSDAMQTDIFAAAHASPSITVPEASHSAPAAPADMECDPVKQAPPTHVPADMGRSVTAAAADTASFSGPAPPADCHMTEAVAQAQAWRAAAASITLEHPHSAPGGSAPADGGSLPETASSHTTSTPPTSTAPAAALATATAPPPVAAPSASPADSSTTSEPSPSTASAPDSTPMDVTPPHPEANASSPTSPSQMSGGSSGQAEAAAPANNAAAAAQNRAAAYAAAEAVAAADEAAAAQGRAAGGVRAVEAAKGMEELRVQLGLDRAVVLVSRAALEEAAALEARLRKAAAMRSTDPPDSFFDLTPDDFAEMARSQRIKQHDAAQLMTTKLRQASETAKAASYGPVRVRLHLPEGVIMQAVFGASEPLSSLQTLASRVVAPELVRSLYLYTAPPKQVLKDLATATFYSSGLIPAAHVYLGVDENSGAASSGSHVRTELQPFVHREAFSAEAAIEQHNDRYAEGASDRQDTSRASSHAAGEAAGSSRSAGASGSAVPGGGPSNYKRSEGKVPKWLKMGK